MKNNTRKTLKSIVKQSKKQGNQIATIGTWLPIFTGYYNTIFDPTDSYIEYETSLSESEYQEYYSELHKAGVTYEYFQSNLWDHIELNNAFTAVSEYICDALINLDHCDIIESIEFDKLVSPKYYNFSTDSINCDITYNVTKLQKYIDKNLELYADYIGEKYTSRDGFSSHYSNDIEDWKDMSDLGAHELGSVLQFVMQNEDNDAELNLYYESNINEAFSNEISINYDAFIKSFNESEAA